MQFKVLQNQRLLKSYQIENLTEFFGENAYPSTKQKEVLATRLDLSFMQVSSWFERQRRAKRKTSEEIGENSIHTFIQC